MLPSKTLTGMMDPDAVRRLARARPCALDGNTADCKGRRENRAAEHSFRRSRRRGRFRRGLPLVNRRQQKDRIQHEHRRDRRQTATGRARIRIRNTPAVEGRQTPPLGGQGSPGGALITKNALVYGLSTTAPASENGESSSRTTEIGIDAGRGGAAGESDRTAMT